MKHDISLFKDLLTKLYIFKCNTKWLDEIYGTIVINNIQLSIEVESSDHEELEGFDCLKAKFSLREGKDVYYFFIEDHLEKSGIVFCKDKYSKNCERTVIYAEGKWKVTCFGT